MTDQNETKEVMKRDPIYDLLTTYKTAIKNVLPKHLTAERILRIAYTAIHRSPKLRDCTHESIINAVLEVSMLGLDIGRTAHIIPFGREAVFIPDYKGYIDLAHRSERIEAFTFKPVYEQDDFQYEEGTSRFIKHKPYRGVDRGGLVAAYSIVFFKHGGFDFEVVEAPDIVATKKFSPAVRANKKDSPWLIEDLEWTMWCKTAVRRLAKRVPQSPEFQRAAYLEELAESGLSQDIAHVSKTIDIGPVPEAADLTDKIKEAKQDEEPEIPCPYCQKEIKSEIIESFKAGLHNFICPHCQKEGKVEDGKPIGIYPPNHTARNSKDYQESVPVFKEGWDAWRKEWKNLREPGFSTYFHKNRAKFEAAPSELKEGARVKWLGLYPETPWPLDTLPETEEDEKHKKLRADAENSLTVDINKFDKSVVNSAMAALDYGVGQELALQELETLLKECKEIESATGDDQRVSMIDAIQGSYKEAEIQAALVVIERASLGGCNLDELKRVYENLRKGEGEDLA